MAEEFHLIRFSGEDRIAGSLDEYQLPEMTIQGQMLPATNIIIPEQRSPAI
jgi:hypothetical protein